MHNLWYCQILSMQVCRGKLSGRHHDKACIFCLTVLFLKKSHHLHVRFNVANIFLDTGCEKGLHENCTIMLKQWKHTNSTLAYVTSLWRDCILFPLYQKPFWAATWHNHALSEDSRSAWASVDAQADLSLRWAHSHFVCFVMLRLIYIKRLDSELYKLLHFFD